MSVQLLARYEFKYGVHPDRMDDIRRMLKPYCTLDETGVRGGDGFYTIDSLYLDTAANRFYQDAEDGLQVRIKLRVRTYPDTPDSVVKIEVKRRCYDLISKTSTAVAEPGWAEWLRPGADWGALPPPARRSLATFTGLRDTLGAAPKILVRYRRQAFHGRFDDYVRITFDRHMCYQPMRRYELRGEPRRWRAVDDPGSLGTAGHLIMEVKFKERPPVWVVDFVRRLGLRRQGFSKYGSAVRRTRMDWETLWNRAPALAAA